MGILDKPLRINPIGPYDDRTRPWFLDMHWQLFLGRPHDEVASINTTTITADIAQFATGCVVANAAGLAVGELFVVGTGANSETVVITAIAGTTLTVVPGFESSHVSGETAGQLWTNDTHPTATGYLALGQFIANAKQRTSLCGPNLLSTGGMVSTYTDTNGVATMPVGWETFGGAPASVIQSTYGMVSVSPNARNGKGFFFSTSTGDTRGARTLQSIPVKAGEVIVVSANTKTTSGFPVFQAVDKNSPTTILATTNVGENSAVTGSRGGWQNLGRRTVLSFVVPGGVTDIEVRIRGNAAAAVQCYIDDVRVLRGRTNMAAGPRYVIEDPGDQSIVVGGDSWGVGAFTAVRDALNSRAGRTLNIINAAVSGERLDQQNTRFLADIAPYQPRYYVHVSGFANDLVQTRTQTEIERDVDYLVRLCRERGITPVILGAAPIGTIGDTTSDRNDQIRARLDLAAA